MAGQDKEEDPWSQLVSSTDFHTPPVLISAHKFVLGRNADCDLTFSNNKHVSGKHCYLEKQADGRVLLYDTSTNGTVVNMKFKISKGEWQELKHGDEFHIVHKKTNPTDDIGFIFQDLQSLEEETSSDSDNTLDYSLSQCDATIADAEVNDVCDGGDVSRKRKCEDLTDSLPSKKMTSLSAEFQPQGTEVKTSPELNQPSFKAEPNPPSTDSTVHKACSSKTTTNAASSQGSDEMEESLLCSICTDLLHDCVSLQPCMHSYCGGCYSDWMERSDQCPSCRVKVERINKNHIVNNLVAAFLKLKPEKCRAKEELEELNWKNKITRDMLYPDKITAPESVDFESDESEEGGATDDQSEEDDAPLVLTNHVVLPPPRLPPVICRQCPNYTATNLTQTAPTMQAGPSTRDESVDQELSAPPAFTCTHNQNHVLCLCCLTPMPDRHAAYLRGETTSPQQCSLCFRAFCHAYWGCRRVECKGCLGKLKDLKFGQKCPASLILNNAFESNILQQYLELRGLSVDHLLAECLASFVTGEFTCTRQAELRDGINTVVCYTCGLRVFSELAYFYRRDIPAHQLPDGAVRPDCYWGKNCRTQRNKPEHAQRFNHICEQTRTV